MIRREIQGQEFFTCPHDGTVVRLKEEHQCIHALIANCFSMFCIGKERDLDLFGNCVTCGSGLVDNRRLKYGRKESLKSLKIEELTPIHDLRCPRPFSIADFRQAVRWLLARIGDIRGIFNTGWKFNKSLTDEKIWSE